MKMYTNTPSQNRPGHPGSHRARGVHWVVAVVLVVVGAVAQSAHAQGTLTGRVVNSATGDALQGARVVIVGTGEEAITDSTGVYRFEDVPAGSAVLAVSYTGLSRAEETVEVAASGITRKNVGLTSDIYRLSEYVITSEREGNAEAITLQRQSVGIKNIVAADAFGGLAGNPADLAIMLPGVEGESVGGDMRYVRIRGLHHNLNSVTQDGNRLADAGSAGATREFQFQTVSSDSIERIEVIKSPTPDMDGDSIGGVVNLVTKSAFDSPERRIRASVGAIWRATDPRDDPRPNGSFYYSEVFQDKFGINLNLAYRPHLSAIDTTFHNHELLPAGVEGPAFQYRFQARDFRNVRTRSGAGLRFDYKLNDEVRFFASFQYNKHVEHSDHTWADWSTNQSVAAVDADGTFTGTGGIIPGYTDEETRVRPVDASEVAIASLSTFKIGTTSTINLGAVHRHPGLDLDYDVYSSKSKAEYPGNNTLTFTLPNVGFNITKDDEKFPTVTQTAGPDWTRLDSYAENDYRSDNNLGWDEYIGAAFNAKKEFEIRFPAYVKAGVRYRRQTRDLARFRYRTTYVGPDGVEGPNPANGGLNDDNLARFGQLNRPYPDTRLEKYGFMPFPEFQAEEREHSVEPLIAANPAHWERNLAADVRDMLTNDQQFREEIRAAYIMGDVQLGKLGVLAGVRVEKTETEGEGSLQLVTPEERARREAWEGPLTDAEIERRAYEEYGRRQRRAGSYTSVFPGLHLKYQFNDNLLARFSYSESIGRPNIGTLIPRTTVDLEDQELRTSNPSLEPQWSSNYDLSVEYYFEPVGLLSLGVFQKDIEKFIFTSGGTFVGEGPDNGFNGEYAGFELTTQYNGGSAKVKGLEVSYSQQFTFLPGIWEGLGAFANATWLESEGNYGAGNPISPVPNPEVAGFNPFIANVGISYIRGSVSLRAAFNYRHEYLVAFNANESRRQYAAARPTLDLKMLYNFNRNISAYLDIVNVTMTPDRERLFGYGRFQRIDLMRPQFLFGVNMRL
ncbi:MAG: TonB-dependent receptor [Opitutaceae bacterium]